MAAHRRLFSLCQHLQLSSSLDLLTRVTNGLSQVSLHHQAGAPQIIAEPRVALYDEKVKIFAKNFQPHEKITLIGNFLHGKANVIFASCGQYTTDDAGNVDVWEDASVGGTYTGMEPMGLVWSLKPAPGQSKYTRMKLNITDKPFIITLRALKGHLSLEEIYAPDAQFQSLAETQLERWFRFSDKVTRIEVASGNLRGALFLPKGDGPFQGVIDLFGSAGGIIEYRAALLASRGFAAFSLPYFNYKDLPKSLFDVTYDYFEEAIEWFVSHPKVHKHGIGVVAVSKGVEFAMCMSAFSKWIKAEVLINGNTYFGICDLYHKGQVLAKGSEFQVCEIVFDDDGAADLTQTVPFNSNIIPAWQNDAKLLFFVSGNDNQFDINCYKYYLDACPEEKKEDVEVVKYPGAGHLLEPPYTALCRATENRSFGMLMLFGGLPKEHAHAQEDSWLRTLAHLRKNIPTS